MTALTSLSPDPNLPNETSPQFIKQLRYQLDLYLRRLTTQVNNLSDGRVSAVNNAHTSAPTTGKHAQGDFVKNSTPSELGSVSSKYVILGWVCTVSGEPGTWLEVRTLTGN